jgi:hypothetical protein
MSPTPVTYRCRRSPRYSWEATDEEVAARYGVPSSDRPVRPQHLAAPPELAARPAGGAFERRCPSTRRPTTAGSSRRPPRATASRPTSCSSGAGADEILDLVGKAFLPPGGAAVVPAPTYAMYRVVTEQRGAGRRRARGRRRAAGRSTSRRRGAPRPDARSSGCAARTTRPASPSRRRDRALLDGLAADAARPAGAPIVVLDEAYAEFVGTSLLGSAPASEPRRRPHREQGLRARRAAGRVRRRPARDDRPDRSVPSTGSVSSVSVSIVDAA